MKLTHGIVKIYGNENFKQKVYSISFEANASPVQQQLFLSNSAWGPILTTCQWMPSVGNEVPCIHVAAMLFVTVGHN